MSRYESEELIVAARMPDMMMPARKAGRSPVDMTMKMFSALLFVSSSAGYRARPMRPMATAASSEIAHQIVAMRLDFLTSEVVNRHEPEKDLRHAKYPGLTGWR